MLCWWHFSSTYPVGDTSESKSIGHKFTILWYDRRFMHFPMLQLSSWISLTHMGTALWCTPYGLCPVVTIGVTPPLVRPPVPLPCSALHADRCEKINSCRSWSGGFSLNCHHQADPWGDMGWSYQGICFMAMSMQMLSMVDEWERQMFIPYLYHNYTIINVP